MQLLEYIAKLDAHKEKPPPIYQPRQYKEEEYQSQLVANPNGHYMEDEWTYYHEQVVILRNEEVVDNQLEERKEKQIEDPQEPHTTKKTRFSDSWNRGTLIKRPYKGMF